jgi:hypothetical protein
MKQFQSNCEIKRGHPLDQMAEGRLSRFLLTFGWVAPPDCLYKRRARSPKDGSDKTEVGNSAEPLSKQS